MCVDTAKLYNGADTSLSEMASRGRCESRNGVIPIAFWFSVIEVNYLTQSCLHLNLGNRYGLEIPG